MRGKGRKLSFLLTLIYILPRAQLCHDLHVLLCVPDLYTLFHEVLAHPCLHIGCVHSSDYCLEGSIDCRDPTATLHGDIEVVGQRPSRHLENIVRGFLVQKDLTEGGDEGARGAPGQRHKQEVRQDAGNNQRVRCLRGKTPVS